MKEKENSNKPAGATEVIFATYKIKIISFSNKQDGMRKADIRSLLKRYYEKCTNRGRREIK